MRDRGVVVQEEPQGPAADRTYRYFAWGVSVASNLSRTARSTRNAAKELGLLRSDSAHRSRASAIPSGRVMKYLLLTELIMHVASILYSLRLSNLFYI
jgi:hypothetical protein